MQCESLTVQCYTVFKLTISSVISKLGNLMQSYVSRSIENSLCLIGLLVLPHCLLCFTWLAPGTFLPVFFLL